MAEQNNNTQVQDTNALIQVRKDKLKDLIERGKNPFEITKYDVTHHTSDVKELYILDTKFDITDLINEVIRNSKKVLKEKEIEKGRLCAGPCIIMPCIQDGDVPNPF